MASMGLDRDDTRPLTNSVGILANRRWVPPSSIKRDAFTPEERNDIVFRKVRGILNKLTPEKFHKLSEELLSVGLDSTQILKGVILLIFDKALDEPKYSSMYAQLCRKLCEEAPNFDPPSNNSSCSGNNQTFRRLLLAKCKDEFENRRRASEAFDKKDGLLSAEEEEQRSVAKHKMLGNIKFIGELGKQGLLQETILHQCIHQLLAKKKRHALQDVAQDLECLCQIMRTVGRRLDTEIAKSLMDQYFGRMKIFAKNAELPSRIRFMLQDTMELRMNKWVPRRATLEHGPRTIQQIREEAARDYGVYMASAAAAAAAAGAQLPYGLLSRSIPVQALALGSKGRGGLDDVFGPLPLGVGNLGTGPGVIPTDGFPAYSSNMGRPNRNNMNNANLLGSGSSQLFYGGGGQNRSSGSGGRDLFPNYQQSGQGQSGGQQGQQNQSNSRQTSQSNFNSASSNRDLPPRFMRRQQHSNSEEISLRPAQNSMVLKPKPSPPLSSVSGSSNNMGRDIGSNSILAHNANNLANPLQKEAPIVIKQVAQDKNKGHKGGPGPTKEEVLKRMEQLLQDLLTQQNSTQDLGELVQDLKIPKKFLSEVLAYLMIKTLKKSESDRELLSSLFVEMKAKCILTGPSLLEAMKSVYNQLSELDSEVPRVKSCAAGFVARAVAESLLGLGEVSEPLEGGQHYPLFLLCLQQLHKGKGRAWLTQHFNQSKVNLLFMLPEVDRTKDRLADVLDDRGLSFLYPLLRIQADLWKQLQVDPSPSSLYRWVKENVDPQQHTAQGFINALVTCMIKFITQETTLGEGVDPSQCPDKLLLDKEKDLLDKFKPVFQAFLHEQPKLQLISLYALQVHCYNNQFPKGMLLRWFMMMYDLEVIEEEAFLKWKEDVNDEYPGKGKALFQVNQWLTWLEEAEEEEEEGSDDGEN